MSSFLCDEDSGERASLQPFVLGVCSAVSKAAASASIQMPPLYEETARQWTIQPECYLMSASIQIQS